MKSKFLNLKEFVLVLLLACLETVIGLVAAMPFAANLQLVYFLVPGLTGLINGIIYVLLIKKCPKVGTQFIIPFVYGLLFLFSGSVYVFMFFAILAVANELIMIGGYGKKVRQAIPHVLTWSLNSMGSTLTLLLFRDSMVQTYVKMGMSAVDAEAAVQKALDEISKERTVIMIAHRLKTVRGAQQILVLEKGRITQKGTHNQLVGTDGLYSRLWELQNQAGNYTFKQS